MRTGILDEGYAALVPLLLAAHAVPGFEAAAVAAARALGASRKTECSMVVHKFLVHCLLHETHSFFQTATHAPHILAYLRGCYTETQVS